MSRRVSLLPEVHIASPCPARWDEMRGDDRRRFCETCGKHVHNFSELRDAEILDVLRGESICAQLYRRPDGTFVTADCPVGVRLARTHVGKASLRAAAFIVAFFGAASYALTGARVAAIDRATQSLIRQSAPEPLVVAGEIAPMPPTTTQPILGKLAPTMGLVAAPPATCPSD